MGIIEIAIGVALGKALYEMAGWTLMSTLLLIFGRPDARAEGGE